MATSKRKEKKKNLARVLDIPTAGVVCQRVCPLQAAPSIYPSIYPSRRMEDAHNETIWLFKKKGKGKVRDRTEGITYCAENTDKPVSVLLVLPISRQKLQNVFWSFCVLFFLTPCTEETFQHSFSTTFTNFLPLPW